MTQWIRILLRYIRYLDGFHAKGHICDSKWDPRDKPETYLKAKVVMGLNVAG